MDRYHRQILLPQVRAAGQHRLGAASVLLIGCGALGTTIADQLARAGVGRLTVVDRDTVELTNLQRQTLFAESDVAEQLPKAIAAERRLRTVNSAIRVDGIVTDVSADNIERLIEQSQATLLLDGTDNVETRYLVNDVAVKRGIPWVYGGCVGIDGRVMPIVPSVTPCLRCLFPAPPGAGEVATCDTAGVLGPAASVVASLQAAMALRLIVEGFTPSGGEGRGEGEANERRIAYDSHAASGETRPHPNPLAQGAREHRAAPAKLLTIDVWAMRFREIDVADARRADCPCCGRRQYEFLDRAAPVVASLCGRNSVQVRTHVSPTFSLASVETKLRGRFALQSTPYFLKGKFEEGIEMTLFADGRVLVHGTADPVRARTIVARYLG